MTGTDVAPPFTSKRERNLWLLALTVVIAIYSTLGLARTLADELRNRDLLDNISAVGFLVIFAAVLLAGFKGRAPSAATIAITMGVAAVYLLVFMRMASPMERSHLIEYSVLAILIHEALLERVRRGRAVPLPGVLAVAATALIGIFDELIQLVIPSRVFDPIDIGFNVFAAVMAVAAGAAIGWVSRRRAVT